MTLELSNSTENPKLAVIVPVYKVEKYLPKCLDSIINQTYKNLQIICVDDGSPDNCGTILDDYAKKDSRIIVIHKENGGVSSARNAALDFIHESWKLEPLSFSKFITFVDPDDYIDLCTYEKCINVLTDDIDVLAFASEYVFDDGEPDPTGSCDKGNGLGLIGKHDLSEQVISATSFSICNKIFRSKIIYENNLRFPDGLCFEDAYFSTLYLCHCKTIWFEQSLFYKYLRGRVSSITGVADVAPSDLPLHCVKIVAEVLKYLKQKELFNKHKDVFWSFFFQFIKVSIDIKHTDEVECAVYKEALNILNAENFSAANILHNHYCELIVNRKLKDANTYSLLWTIRHKHRLNYDKFSFIGIPVLKITYTEHYKIIEVLGLFKFKRS